MTLASWQPSHWLPYQAVETGESWPAAVSRTQTHDPTAQVGFEHSLNSPSLLLCLQVGSSAPEVQSFASQLSQLLGASLDHTVSPGRAMNRRATLANEISSTYDLMLITEPPQSWVSRFIFGSAISPTLEQAPTSLLVVRQPRWPLQQILLVVRSEEVHGQAAGWTVRLARASGAAVTVLALVPQFSPIPSREARQQQGLLMLLACHTPLERQVIYVSQQLQEGGLEASLRLRPGSPDQQIQAELDAQSYDLIILATESKDGWLRRLLGESVEPVLNRAACPVLLAKPGCF